jgi:hypothetical protein
MIEPRLSKADRSSCGMGTCQLQCDGSSLRAMPSARALLVASLLAEPPCRCLGPSGNDRYRERSLCSPKKREGKIKALAPDAS